jgi:uncharacterized membrane protein
MSLKSATLFAFIGTLLLTLLLLAGFVRDAVSFGSGLIPALQLFRSLIYLVASLSVTVFLFVFHKSQS